MKWKDVDYTKAWEVLKQAPDQAYRTAPYSVYGSVFYRHSEGANICFYDGHVEYKKKEDVFNKTDFSASPKNPGIWVVDKTVWKKYNPYY